MTDASAYYLIGYAPERDSADGRFHKIDVRVRQKGLRVLARKGYWAPKADELNPPMTVAAPPPEIVRALDPLSRDKEPRVVNDWIGVGPVLDGHARVTVACQPIASRSKPANVSTVQVSIDVADRELSPPRDEAETVPVNEAYGVWLAEATVPSGA